MNSPIKKLLQKVLGKCSKFKICEGEKVPKKESREDNTLHMVFRYMTMYHRYFDGESGGRILFIGEAKPDISRVAQRVKFTSCAFTS